MINPEIDNVNRRNQEYDHPSDTMDLKKRFYANFGNLEFIKKLHIHVNQCRSVSNIGEIPKYSINDSEIATTKKDNDC